MSAFDQGEVRADVIQELRVMASRNADVPELVQFLQDTLQLNGATGFMVAIVYFRAAFDLSLREALPLREWIGARDRSEIDSILIPAMQRSRSHWEAREALQT
jgi:hypothetical protein